MTGVFITIEQDSGHAQLDSATGAYLALLRMIPDSEDTRAYVVLNDLTIAEQLLAESWGIMRPSSDADTDTVKDYAVSLGTKLMLANGPYISGLNSRSTHQMQELRTNAGYDFRNVRQTITAGNPPNLFHAITLDGKSHDVKDHLSTNTDLPQPKAETYQGTPILQWGEDFRVDIDMRLTPPVFDELGRGANLAFGDQAIFHTVWNQGVKAMIDAQDGRLRALADVEDFRLMAEALQAMGVYSALLTENTLDLESTRGAFDGGAYEALIPLKPYHSLATGIGKDDDGFYMSLILIHEDVDAARANISVLQTKLETESSLSMKKPWSNYFAPAELEIVIDGRVLLARIPFANGETASSIWLRIVFRRDGLFLHE